MEHLHTEQVVGSTWFLYLDDKQKNLVRQALTLHDREVELNSNLEDYSFLVFGMSKAYEGFLKKFLRDVNIISDKVYEGRRFRIGRALNPDVHTDQRDRYWLYDDVTHMCGEPIARQMWETWLECRNQVFHFFPKEVNSLTLPQAQEYLLKLIDTMQQAVECKMSLDR